METIKRKTGLRYREMIWIGGRPIKSPLFERKSDCRDWLAKQRTLKAQQEIIGGSTNLFSRATLQEYSENWLSIKEPTLQRKSNDEYRRYFRKHINPALGTKELKALTRKDIEKLQSDLLRKLSPKSTNCILTLLKSVLDDAFENGFIPKDPSRGLKDVTEDPPAENFWSHADINAFLLANEEADPVLCELVLFALNTGLRRGELAALGFDVVFFQQKVAHIFRTRDQVETKQRTKTALRRAVPLNSIAMSILQKRFNKRGSGNEVFTELDGSSIDVHHLYRRFDRAQTRAKIENKIRFHDTRVTFATHFMMNGGDVYQLQKILGHTKIEMTMRYARYSPKYLQDAVSDFGLGKDLKEFNHILTTARNSEDNLRIFSSEKPRSMPEIHEAFQ